LIVASHIYKDDAVSRPVTSESPFFRNLLGRSADPITECFIARHMQAKSPGEAIQKALAMMQTQNLVFNARPASDRRSNIEALENLIVAQEEH
jgi:hypothetical protein